MGELTEERVRRAFQQGAVQARHWPRGHGKHWGKDINGEWTSDPNSVTEFG